LAMEALLSAFWLILEMSQGWTQTPFSFWSMVLHRISSFQGFLPDSILFQQTVRRIPSSYP